MAISDPYATLEELQDRLGGVNSSADDTKMTNALAVASRGIEKICRRQFNKTTSATARLFYPESRELVKPHDFHTTTGLVIEVDHGNSGTYETVYTHTTDIQLEPLDGIVDGEEGWPYWKLRAVTNGAYYPTASRTRRASVRVTAQWGWTAVPESIKEACKAVAQETFKLGDAPFGVMGMGEWGVVRVRENPVAMAMIARYRRDPVLVA